MKHAWEFFVEVWKLVLGKENLIPNIKIFWPLIVMWLVAIPFTSNGGRLDIEKNFAFGICYLFLLWIIIAWCSVAFHRRLLLGEEQIGLFPSFDMTLVLGYMGRELLIILALILPVLAFGLVFAGIAMSSIDSGTASEFAYFEGFGTLIFLPFYWVCLRVSIILAARAVDAKIWFGEAWDWTSKQGSFFWIIAALMVVTEIGTRFVLDVFGNPVILTAIWDGLWYIFAIATVTLTYQRFGRKN